MSIFASTSSAVNAQANFNDMLKNFGVVTVMNARVFKRPLYNASNAIINAENLEDKKAYDILQALLALDSSEYVKIDTLKIANINLEGPTKTVTGGQYVNPLIKFGKTATIEMQDALGRGDVIELLGGGIIEDFVAEQGITVGNTNVLHMTQDFAGAKTILGESFFIDQKSGAQVHVYILLYEMLPDSIMNLTQDAEGDATVFDLNGSLSAVDILVSDQPENPTYGGIVKGVFYSILPKLSIAAPAEKPYKAEFALVEGEDDPMAAVLVAGTEPVAQAAQAYTLPVYTGYEWHAEADGSDSAITEATLEMGINMFYLKKSE